MNNILILLDYYNERADISAIFPWVHLLDIGGERKQEQLPQYLVEWQDLDPFLLSVPSMPGELLSDKAGWGKVLR